VVQDNRAPRVVQGYRGAGIFQGYTGGVIPRYRSSGTGIYVYRSITVLQCVLYWYVCSTGELRYSSTTGFQSSKAVLGCRISTGVQE
jgi:hypothetical protein